ncbi:hypothetical protein [Mycobacterium sp. OTB74]|uniref:hypothetical protein n=1 Tax=Mycobacterium sp. OTB74 TaxID=1853452 RepID=UPI0024749706|nr:hypothetical protein [Mycobacterium sp. OTB74]MDH6246844.1 hypothetical protein [Mycobacterium sp. OTB74]
MNLYDRDGRKIPIEYQFNLSQYPNDRMACDQRVARHEVGAHVVSTVWLLGIDHRGLQGGGPVNLPGSGPMIFETVVSGPRWNEERRR